MTFKLGLIINPLAGLGGSVALKGSDGADIVNKALYLGAIPKAALRVKETLSMLQSNIEIYTYPGEMGADLARSMGFTVHIFGAISAITCAADTEQAARDLSQQGIDILLFVGGDGTARDVFKAIGTSQACLGVPAGVKMHSAVYAVSPRAAGELLQKVIAGEVVNLLDAEVRDIDEEAFRNGHVRSKYYGELRVPQHVQYLQQAKIGGKEVEALVIQDMAADIQQRWSEDEIESDTIYIVGSGSTTLGVMNELGIDSTLLGIDIVQNGILLESDVTEQQILTRIAGKPAKILVSLIGGQGHVFGRGNQQLSAEVINGVGKSNIWIIASKSKLESLQGRPLLVDTGDSDLDESLSGHTEIICGFEDYVFYPLGRWE